jgi:hypothetical protein
VKLTIISYSGWECYAPIILTGGTISGKKLHKIVEDKIVEELAKPEHKEEYSFDSYDAQKVIVNMLITDYGFSYPEVDEFIMDESDINDRYWRESDIRKA